MSRLIRYTLFTLFVILSFYYAWSEGDRRIGDAQYNKLSANTPALLFKSIGTDRNTGNILGVQAFMNVLDYSSPERFYDKMDFYIGEAKKKGFVKDGTVILLPEHIGTPLVLLGEKRDVYAANTLSSAFYQIAISNLIGYYQTLSTALNHENKGEIIFKMKAEEMKSVYVNTFSKLSAFYGITIIAGSIFLPEPVVNLKANDIQLNNGKILNSGFIFLPDGKIHLKMISKQNLSKTERQLAVSLNTENTFLQLKNMGIVFSNDSLYHSVYGETFKNMEILLSPAILFEKDEIDWKNEDILGAKETLDANLAQKELWKKYSILGKTKASQSNRVVLQVYLLGKFFDLTLEGESYGMIRYVATEELDNKNPAILNVWF